MFLGSSQRHFSALLNQWSFSRTILYLQTNVSFELDNPLNCDIFKRWLLRFTFKSHMVTYTSEVMRVRISLAALYTHQIKQHESLA